MQRLIYQRGEEERHLAAEEARALSEALQAAKAQHAADRAQLDVRHPAPLNVAKLCRYLELLNLSLLRCLERGGVRGGSV